MKFAETKEHIAGAWNGSQRPWRQIIIGLRDMKQLVPVRITVFKPLPGVTMKVQQGRNELLPPTKTTADSISFDIQMTVDLSSGSPNFLGKYAQGPKNARFIYVNSGTYAGQQDSCWSRRAKISLMNITAAQLTEVLSVPGSRLEAVFDGVDRDGGPTCASVKGVEWRTVRK